MGLVDDESIWRGKIFTGAWTSTGNDETPATFGGLGDSGGSSRFGALTNLDEFTVWQWVTVRDAQSHPTF